MFKNKWRCEVYRCTLQGTNISHLGTKENHLQKCWLGWDMLVPRRVLHTSKQPSPPKTPLERSPFWSSTAVAEICQGILCSKVHGAWACLSGYRDIRIILAQLWRCDLTAEETWDFHQQPMVSLKMDGSYYGKKTYKGTQLPGKIWP